MNQHRERLLQWTGCLLDAGRSPGDQRQAAEDWCAWALGTLGIDENVAAYEPAPFFGERRLPTGKAISPLGAARCVREYRRTAVFLQAMDAALRSLFERFPGETIHVLEAGSGPLAPLAFPFALRYPPKKVVFAILDIHPAALDGARRIAELLGIGSSVRAYMEADATTVRFAEPDRPHLIACEVLLRALTKEPQVAATLNLAPQLRPGGCFLPERIDVRVGFLNPQRLAPRSGPDLEHIPPASRDIAPVFSLDAARLGNLSFSGPDFIDGARVVVPNHDRQRNPLRLFTRIRVWGDHVLDDFDSSLNLPEPLDYPATLADAGGEMAFSYRICEEPGLRATGSGRCATDVARIDLTPSPGRVLEISTAHRAAPGLA
jgi:SAM-dependent methyltransferase